MWVGVIQTMTSTFFRSVRSPQVSPVKLLPTLKLFELCRPFRESLAKHFLIARYKLLGVALSYSKDVDSLPATGRHTNDDISVYYIELGKPGFGSCGASQLEMRLQSEPHGSNDTKAM